MKLSAHNLTLAGRLQDVSLELQPGQLTAICGPNGAGKSSLLSALAGLLTLDQGEARLDGNPLTSMHPQERAKAIGYLPQDGEVAWDVAVRNLVALGRLPHRDSAEEAIECALHALDLGAFADRPVSTLSGGEKARTMLARVLAGEPRWILADEPLAALDLAHQQRLLGELRRQADAGIGVAIVVHDLALAMNHADRVVVLDEGRIIVEGAPDQALSAHVLQSVWDVQARWLGNPGAFALQFE